MEIYGSTIHYNNNVNNSGNVGVGTTNPLTTFNVFGTSTLTGDLIVTNSAATGGDIYFVDTSSGLINYTDSTDITRVYSASVGGCRNQVLQIEGSSLGLAVGGKVGINTSTVQTTANPKYRDWETK